MNTQKTNWPEWSHKFTATKDAPDWGPNHKIKVEAGLHYIQGNSAPYFAVGAEVYQPGARDCEACGCMHEEVLKHWPELAPVVALHLSDIDGQPMHAVENGKYWLGLTKWQDYHKEHTAKHFRITPEEADTLHAKSINDNYGTAEVAAFVQVRSKIWKAEALRAIELLDTLRRE